MSTKLQPSQSGQSLIETIGAIFILTMALTTALGLAVYALSRSAISQQEIIATNLAREGIDVVRGIRDSNWLAGESSSDNSINLQTCPDIGNRLCYRLAYTKPVQMWPWGTNVNDPAGWRIMTLNTSSGSWTLSANNDYRIYLQANGTYDPTVNGTAIFARKIVLVANSAAPYTAGNNEVIVQSIVGWSGKGCTAMTSTDPSTTNCKVVTEEHLTNWKDYR